MIDYEKLARRAQDRSENQGDYWDKAAEFLRTIPRRAAITWGTVRQRNWLHGLVQDLKEPWE